LNKKNLAVGIFMIIGFACLAYLSISFGEIKIFGEKRYRVEAGFSNVSGLKKNTPVELLGIPVGQVSSIELDDFQPRVIMMIDYDLKLPEDTIASIRTQGLLGEGYVHLSPGGLPMNLPRDGSAVIRETEAPLILEEVIGKLVFGETEDS
jgi:phospholipid/cholesterol/gamma-HCH transport system substrate-binding protein